MRSLSEPLRKGKQIRSIGFDDAPFDKHKDTTVKVAGIVCSSTRFEGMLWGELAKDGLDATDVILNMVLESKFYEQLNVVLTDGLTAGGFNIIDLDRLAHSLEIPCIAVMRNLPNLVKFYRAMERVDQQETRRNLIEKAGPIHTVEKFHFQVVGCSADEAATTLQRVTDKGVVPESLRLAHLIGAAVMTGQSSNRA